MPPSPSPRSLGFAWRSAFTAVLLALAVAACSTGDKPEADSPEALGEATSLESMMRIADATRAAGDFRIAVRLYRRTNTLHPDSPVPLVGLGKTLADVGAYGEATDAFRDALALSPDDREALRGLANTLISTGEAELALSHFDRLLELDPTDHRNYAGKGVALDTLGRHEMAQAAYRTGLAAAPKDVSLRNNLGLSLAMSGKHEEAIALLRAVAGEPGATPQTRQNLALAVGLTGDMETAREISAIDLTPQQVEDNMAFIEYVRSRTKSGQAGDSELADAHDRGGAREPKGANTHDAPAQGQGSEAEPAEARLMIDPGSEANASTSPDTPGPYRVQIASRRTVILAYQAWRSVRRRVPDLLQDYLPDISPIDLGESQGTYFRVRTEPSTSKSIAEALCSALKGEKVDCLVVRAKTASPAEPSGPSATSG